MKYRSMYHFEVIDEVNDGNTVYCLDKQNREVYIMNGMPLDRALRVVSVAKNDDERFEFWKETKENA